MRLFHEGGTSKVKVFRNKVIVVGKSHHNALGIIRSLGEFGCEVFLIIISERKSFVTKSRYVKKFWHINSGQQVIDLLLEEFRDETERPIIIPADDYSASIIDGNLHMLDEKFVVPNIGNEQCAIVDKMDKTTMNELAEKHGFLVPKSLVLNLGEVEEINSYVENMDIKYPCIVKPLQSIEGSKSVITVCENQDVLISILNKLKPTYKRILIQEFIEKEGEFGIQGFADHQNNRVIIPGLVIKLRQSTVAPGSTTYGKLVKAHPLIDLAKIAELVRDLEYTGIFDIELIHADGKIYFIEMNFRNGAYGYAFTRAGVNLPVLWCLSALGRDISNISTRVNREVLLMNETADFRNVLEKKMGLLSWVRQFLKADVHLVCNKHDFRPFVHKLLGK